MLVRRPLKLAIPSCGALVAESMHDVRFKMPAERHAFYEIYYVLQGTALYFEAEAESPMTLSESACHPIPAGMTHRLEDQSQTTILLLCFSSAFLDSSAVRRKLWEQLTGRRHRPLCLDNVSRAQVERSLRTIMAEQEGGGFGAEALIESEALRILTLLARFPDDPTLAPAMERVLQVAAIMRRCYFDPWDLDMAAHRARLSRRRFSSLFRAAMGHSFLEYLTELRLGQAAALLRQEKRSIVGAAFAVGFNDVSHFYRLFRARYGTTPGRWAEKERGKET